MSAGQTAGPDLLWALDRGPAPHSAFQPRSAARLALGFGWTLAAVAQLRLGRSGDRVLRSWTRRFLGALSVDIHLASPLPERGQLWVCNHLSWLDPLVCLRLRPSGALAKAEVSGYPLLGHALRRAGLRFVAREVPLSRAAAMARLASDLRQGENLLLFPEGTTTQGDRLAPLYEGSLRAAYRLGSTVLPLRLSCSAPHYPWVGDDSLLPHLWTLARTRRTVVQVHPGPVLRPADFASEMEWLRVIRTHLEPVPTEVLIEP